MTPVAGVAAEGDRRRTLEALRDRLAEELDATASPRDIASLSKRLEDVLVQIDDLADPVEEEDDLAALLYLPGDAVAG